MATRISIALILLTMLSACAYALPAQAEPAPTPTAPPETEIPLIHVPALQVEDISAQAFPRMAIFWFGRVDTRNNYADIRIGYNQNNLSLYAAVFDHDLLHAESPAPSDLTRWDALAIYLQPDNGAAGLEPGAYQFIVQASPGYESFAWYQTANIWNGKTWYPKKLNFSSQSGWRGSAFDDGQPDMGWNAQIDIPFTSLGIEAPAEGIQWRLGIELYDRDTREDPLRAPQVWPAHFSADNAASWGRLQFGRAEQENQNIAFDQEIPLSGSQDAAVGGGATCGENIDFWTAWGDRNGQANENQQAYVNIQNQRDIADWPCFSKAYFQLPLNQIEPDKTIKAAYLRLYQFGNAGQTGSPMQPYRSFIQAFITGANWSAGTITWNNAPQVKENIAITAVEPLDAFPGWPGQAVYWDITAAVQQAIQAGTPLSVALYSADGAYHSGKYFSSADAPDWNAAARPALLILY
jgi:hypothetical protein